MRCDMETYEIVFLCIFSSLFTGCICLFLGMWFSDKDITESLVSKGRYKVNKVISIVGKIEVNGKQKH